MVLVIAVATVFFLLRFRGQENSATVVEVINQVDAHPHPKDDWQPAVLGMAVYGGGQVRTGAASTARLKLLEGMVRLGADSIFTVKESTTRQGKLVTTLFLQEGRLWAHLMTDQSHEFTVETGNAVAAVRDTRFSVWVIGDTTFVSVAEGEVALTAQGQMVTVRAGQQAAVEGDQPPSLPDTMGDEERALWATVGEILQLLPPASTPAPIKTPMPTRTFTPVPASTKTPTPVPVSTEIPTLAHTPTRDPTPTGTFTETPTLTLTPTQTQTPTPTYTPTDTPSPTFTPTPIPPVTLHVRAYIDGTSNLIVRGDIVYWHHLGAAAPGRLLEANEPTVLNGVAWYPTWPDTPDSENRGCDCDSSTYVGAPPLAMQDQIVSLEIIQARHTVNIIQQPTAANDYTLIIGFDDSPPGGADWYEISIGYIHD